MHFKKIKLAIFHWTQPISVFCTTNVLFIAVIVGVGIAKYFYIFSFFHGVWNGSKTVSCFIAVQAQLERFALYVLVTMVNKTENDRKSSNGDTRFGASWLRGSFPLLSVVSPRQEVKKNLLNGTQTA